MAKNPAERYATAGDFASDLQRFIEDRPIEARKPTSLQKGRKWCRRHRTLVTTTIVFLATLLAFLATGATLLAVRLGEVARQEKAMAQKQRDARQKIASLLAGSYNDQEQMLCTDGELAAGILWMAHSLHVVPEESADLRRVIRQNLVQGQTLFC